MNDRIKEQTAHQAIEHLQKLTELFQHRRVQLAKAVKLTEQQWRVLEEISTEHFIPSMFARNRESSPAAVSKIIRQLTEKGLINVSISSIDGRQRQYVLTAKGKKLMETIRIRRLQAIDSIWMRFDQKELDQFNRFSTRLIKSIETYTAKEEQ
jgi:DNA-binding MarR family transcriptional regulator